MTELPPEIGPHEGREFDLMRRGEKHVAMFTDYEPDGLKELLSEGGFSTFTDWRDLDGHIYPTVFVYRDSHREDAHRLCALTRNPPRGFDPQYEHAVGRILGYTSTEVDAFLAHASR